MKKLTILAGTAVLAVAAGAAFAVQPADAPRFDRNADITRQQVIERTDQRFARLDVNHDGRATREEGRQAAQQHRAEAAGRMFDRLDLNHDGSITRAEFDQARAQRQQQRAERGGERGPRMGMRGNRGGPRMGMRRMGPGGPGGPGMRGARPGGFYGEQGFVTLEQMRAQALERFDRADANHDGTLTAAERQQSRDQMREQFRERMQQRQGDAN